MNRRLPAPKFADWLTNVPAEWDVERLGNVAKILFSNVDKHTIDGEIPVRLCNYVDVYKNDRITHDIDFMEASAEAREIARFQIHQGDVLATKDSETPDDIAISSLVGEDLPGVLCGYHLALIRPRQHLAHGPYLAWLHACKTFRAQYEAHAVGVTRFGLSQAAFKEARVPLPSPPGQSNIAAYLDASCAAIDAAVAAKRHQVEILQALHRSTITHAVTAGLDPSAKKKGSNTSWFRDLPSHWRIERLKDLISKFVDYRGKTPEKTAEGIPLVTARNIRNGRIDFSLSQEYISEVDYDDWMVRGFPEQGDVLVTTEAPMGEVASVEDTRIALAQRIVLLKTNSAEMTNDYLRYFLLSAAGSAEIRRYATGSTALGIKARWLKIISVLVPPVEEQIAIARYLDGHCKQVEPLIQRIEEQIETLVAYRNSLIHECVTGQRRVTQADLKRVGASV